MEGKTTKRNTQNKVESIKVITLITYHAYNQKKVESIKEMPRLSSKESGKYQGNVTLIMKRKWKVSRKCDAYNQHKLGSIKEMSRL